MDCTDAMIVGLLDAESQITNILCDRSLKPVSVSVFIGKIVQLLTSEPISLKSTSQ